MRSRLLCGLGLLVCSSLMLADVPKAHGWISFKTSRKNKKFVFPNIWDYFAPSFGREIVDPAVERKEKIDRHVESISNLLSRSKYAGNRKPMTEWIESIRDSSNFSDDTKIHVLRQVSEKLEEQLSREPDVLGIGVAQFFFDRLIDGNGLPRLGKPDIVTRPSQVTQSKVNQSNIEPSTVDSNNVAQRIGTPTIVIDPHLVEKKTLPPSTNNRPSERRDRFDGQIQGILDLLKDGRFEAERRPINDWIEAIRTSSELFVETKEEAFRQVQRILSFDLSHPLELGPSGLRDHFDFLIHAHGLPRLGGSTNTEIPSSKKYSADLDWWVKKKKTKDQKKKRKQNLVDDVYAIDKNITTKPKRETLGKVIERPPLPPVPPLTGNLSNYQGPALPFLSHEDQYAVVAPYADKALREERARLWNVKTFGVGKKGEDVFNFQDAYATNAKDHIYVIADGATEGAASGLFARLLSRAIAAGGRLEGAGFEALVKNEMAAWKAKIDSRGRELTWFEKKKIAQGPASTIMALKATGRQLSDDGKTTVGVNFDVFSVGDSVVMQIRNGEIELSWPLFGTESFGVNPQLVFGSAANNTKQKITQPQKEQLVGAPGDSFFLVTDALAKWILGEKEAGRSPEKTLLDLTSHGRLVSFVKAKRDHQDPTNPLANDDISMVRIDVPSIAEIERQFPYPTSFVMVK